MISQGELGQEHTLIKEVELPPKANYSPLSSIEERIA
jgi:hypothetical protein